MGCYGLGTTRLLGSVIEANHDEKGIIWPEAIAPYDYHLVILDGQLPEVAEDAHKVIEIINNKGGTILFDDRQGISTGNKFAVADLVGIPKRLVVSKRTAEKRVVEIKDRRTHELSNLTFDSLANS
jgi:prolyl-tRNA synthetase